MIKLIAGASTQVKAAIPVTPKSRPLASSSMMPSVVVVEDVERYMSTASARSRRHCLGTRAARRPGIIAPPARL